MFEYIQFFVCFFEDQIFDLGFEYIQYLVGTCQVQISVFGSVFNLKTFS